MTAQNVPITIEQGATYFMDLLWSQDVAGAPGTPWDLTAATEIRMQIRKNQQSEAYINASSTGGSPMITHGGSNGMIHIKIPASATNLITTKSAQYDLEVEMSTGDVYRLIEGSVTVKPNITQIVTDPIVGA